MNTLPPNNIPNMQVPPPTQVAIKIPFKELSELIEITRAVLVEKPKEFLGKDCCPDESRTFGHCKLNAIFNQEENRIINMNPAPEVMIQVATTAFGGIEMAISNVVTVMDKLESSEDEKKIYPGKEDILKVTWDDVLPMDIPFSLMYECNTCKAVHLLFGRFVPTRDEIIKINEVIQAQIERAQRLANITAPGSSIILPK